VESLDIELGQALLASFEKGEDLADRLRRMRGSIARREGVLLPSNAIRSDPHLPHDSYRLLIAGMEVGRGRLRADMWLAIDPDALDETITGEVIREPVFGLPAQWIPESERLSTQARGYTVVEPATVLTTHCTELQLALLPDLYDLADVEDLLRRCAAREPELVRQLDREGVPPSTLLAVLRNLLREGLTIRNSRAILESLLMGWPASEEALTERVRQGLARHITSRFSDDKAVLHCAELSDEAKAIILRMADGGALSEEERERICHGLETLAELPTRAVLLSDPPARWRLAVTVRRCHPDITVLSTAELLPDAQLQRVGTLTADGLVPDPSAPPAPHAPSSRQRSSGITVTVPSGSKLEQALRGRARKRAPQRATVPEVPPLTMELGVDLVRLVEKEAALLGRVAALRDRILGERGLRVPPLHVRDNLHLAGDCYRLLLWGEPCATGCIPSDRWLALPGRCKHEPPQGEEARDPVFGQHAWWIPATAVLAARAQGFEVTDPAGVLATHLARLLRQQGHELYGLEELKQALDPLRAQCPAVYRDLDRLPRVTILQVFRRLLAASENVGNARAILEALARTATHEADPARMAAQVKQRLLNAESS